ncbi:putative oxidoreductase, aryl-alcohol dehydrogenase like protein [Rivularia sp. PCC 7116]|uniref:aldo/keto reductase n=1 Tax=Rivularia sp. PCC 7116 TaxID=373994 RepID=UPI00029EF67A|nr:aldo/keto reductase [Rivularia sp. PCC 7116]AFY57240.1 putative oxidoreductase, aryl-alcohol dehydrogenase like protein [Rivularia sp. PCC 7116]
MSPTKSISQTFTIANDLTVNRIGYGAMRLTGKPGNFGPYADWEAGEKLLQRAVELGVNFIDTAEAYGPGYNEEIIASALYPYKEGIAIATKGGINKPAPDNIKADGSPEFLRRGVEGSLKRLKLEQIDLYQLHRPDSKVPFSESIGALAELKQEGKIRHIGISNVNLEQIKEARNIVEIASVQNRFSITNREKEDTLNYCSDNGIAFLPYGSLDAHPLKQGAPIANAKGIIADIARKYQVKPNQIALAWLLHRYPNVILIPGTTTIAHVEENIKAGEIQLTDDEMKALNAM